MRPRPRFIRHLPDQRVNPVLLPGQKRARLRSGDGCSGQLCENRRMEKRTAEAAQLRNRQRGGVSLQGADWSKPLRRMIGVFAACATVVLALSIPAHSASPGVALPPPAPAGALSVMTYNVEGLPWPVRWGRDADLQMIGERFAWLRRNGRQPHIVALQEAFSASAKAIPRIAGYRYAVTGPDAGAVSTLRPTAADQTFMAAGSWLHGETQGKFIGSGLLVMSDYPILKISRMAFPSFACAGYDCLANKGALLVTLKVPGVPTPVEILDTHLNSRGASGVANTRSDTAYRRQTEILGQFLTSHHDPHNVLFAAGDYNMGPRPGRKAALLGALDAAIAPGRDLPLRDGLSSVVARDPDVDGDPLDAQWILRRGRDWEFLGNGQATRIKPLAAEILFGRNGSTGPMLSDHMGFAVSYRIDVASAATGSTPGIAGSTKPDRPQAARVDT